jgi:hypothetical protein
VIETGTGKLTQPLPDDHGQACARIEALATIVPSNSYWTVQPRETT